MIGSWRLDRPNTTPEFYDTEVAATCAHIEAPRTPHVIWLDSFDYERYNVGRAA